MKLFFVLSLVCVVSAILQFDGPDQMWSDMKHDVYPVYDKIHNVGNRVGDTYRSYVGKGVDAVRRASSYVKDHGVHAINEGFKYNPGNVSLDASRKEYRGRRLG